MADFPRIVITGLGMVTPLGLDVPSSWKGLLDGKSGTNRITQFDPTDFDVQVSAEVKGFVPEDLMDRRSARRSGRHTQMAVVAANEAVESANLTIDETNRDSIGVLIASSGALFNIGEQERVIDERGPGRVDPLTVPKVGQYSPAVRVGRLLEVRGPNSSVNSACASGGDAIGEAMNLMRLGQADCMLAGGAEAMISRVLISSLGGLGALAKTWNAEPLRASRPFDLKRSGFVLGEGAAILVLETEEFALRRGARILCELAGAGWSFDATDDTAPDVDGQALAMRRALNNAGMTMDDIDYINAHGTSTQLNDKTETAAIKKVFGERAYGIPISSTKSMTGHLAAAAGAVEAAVGVLTLRDQIIAPTINYEYPDPECDLDYVPLTARKAKVDAVLSNSFGLGGENSCLVLKRYG
ncbi:MAG TPA: beta-ketoacyl-[acyl-carrier-protein] synthase II [Dehalococcoidia bacterium]|nr:beta-ketoacyl-[acyl-carrier-protein] synthase II [Dehalococcoidia bacterium]